MIFNLTPHAVSVFDERDDPLAVIEPSGVVARVYVRSTTVGDVDGYPLTEVSFGEVQNLPRPRRETWYIVSSFVANALDGSRPDCIVPDRQVRDDRGRVIGCRAFRRA